MNSIRIEECKNNRNNAIIYLIENNLFLESEIKTPAMKFYIKTLTEGTDCLTDIDRYAHLNMLFGYDIGFKNAMKIDNWLWDTNINDIKDRYPMGYETLELNYKDKKLVQHCVEKLGLDLSFDKWRTEDFKCYEYY